MWVFDGEKWIEEGTAPQTERAPKPMDPREWEEFYPELQVIEVPRIEKRETVIVPMLIP